MIEIIDFVVNTGTLFLLALSSYLFLKDPMRRWEFFGYKPTAIIVLLDPKTKKVVIAKTKHPKAKYPWHFPQGGIYSSDINNAVDEILRREIYVPRNYYKFYKTTPLGTIKISDRKVERKYYPGTISIFPNQKGKAYLGCVIYTDVEKYAKKAQLGYDIDEVKVVSLIEALKLMDPVKVNLLKKLD